MSAHKLAAMRAACEAGYVSTADYVKAKENSMTNPASEIAEINAPLIEILVNKFLAWRLPKSVCSDLCVTDRDYKFQRSGTNLLSADEARQMVNEVFAPEIERLTAQLAKCREALQPFAAACHLYEVAGHDGDRVTSHVAITVGDLRRAKQAFIRVLASTGD